MRRDEIKSIIEKYDKQKNVKVYYDINDLKDTADAYADIYWNMIKESYEYSEVIAILMPTSSFVKDVVFFLDTGVVIRETQFFYDDIIVAGKLDFFYGETISKEVALFFEKDKGVIYSKDKIVSQFACLVMNEIIEYYRGLTSDEEKVDYYIKSMSENNNNLINYVIYKKIISITTDPNIVGELVRKYGFSEICYIYKNSFKKYNKEIFKVFPKAYMELMTLRRKSCDKTINKQWYKIHHHLFQDCREYLLLLQRCNDVRGYITYVSIVYNMFTYLAITEDEIDDKIMHEFNYIVNELYDKICKNMLIITDEEKYEYLNLLKQIGDIYFGNIYCQDNKIHKFIAMQNMCKSMLWYDTFIDSEHSKDVKEYNKVMLNRAYLYKFGASNIEPDDDKMVECLKEAANYGNERACKYLAEYYISIDSKEADKWRQSAKSKGQKVKDGRSFDEKMKEKVGMNLADMVRTMEDVTHIVSNVSNFADSINNLVVGQKITRGDIKEADNRYLDLERSEQKKSIEHEQWRQGQMVKNKQAKAKNMKVERKADRKIKKEERKRK